MVKLQMVLILSFVVLVSVAQANDVIIKGKVENVTCGETTKDHQFYIAHVKILKSLKGKISQKTVDLPFSMACEGYQPVYGELVTIFHPNDLIKIGLNKYDEKWTTTAGNDYKLISKGNAVLPNCKTIKGLCQ